MILIGTTLRTLHYTYCKTLSGGPSLGRSKNLIDRRILRFRQSSRQINHILTISIVQQDGVKAIRPYALPETPRLC
jgi:hypothetical protein